jgi:hypothetical protein
VSKPVTVTDLVSTCASEETSGSLTESVSMGDTGLSASTKKGKTKRRLIFKNFIVFPKK